MKLDLSKFSELSPEKRKQFLAAAGVAAALSALLFFSETGSQLASSVAAMLGMGSDEPAADVMVSQLPPPPPLAASPEDVLDSEELDVFGKALQLSSAEPVEALPSLQSKPAWQALDEIAGWYLKPSMVTQETMLSYLTHEKLWVRLATLQFLAANAELFNAHSEIIKETQHQLVRHEHPSQVRRFLKRAESVDLEVLGKMNKILGL